MKRITVNNFYFLKRILPRILVSLIMLPFLNSVALAEPNYHLVGWINTIVPGGGQYLLGNYTTGAIQTVLETGTFIAGYSNSALSPITLDGVPEQLPTQVTNFSKINVKQRSCVFNTVLKKTVCTTTNSTTTIGYAADQDVDIKSALYADWLQEFGLKYHMVNVFNSFREAAGPNASIGSQGIDQTSTNQLFLAPFQWKNLSDNWVYPAIALSGAVLVYNYNNAVKNGGFSTIAALNKGSQRLYDFTYLGVFPTGSAVPEEMFYRGFVQYEMYGIEQSPFFSIALSSFLYSFSHSADDRASAAITGAYLGWITHNNHGALSKGIAFHFWADVLAGLYQISVVRKESGKTPIFNFHFEF